MTVKQGYTIPLFDLDQDKAKQVIVDQEEGQYLGHVTTILLEDKKTILAVYPKGHGRGAIVMKRSDDGGLTWSGRLATPKSWETSREVPTIFRTVDKNGKKRLLLFSGLYPIRLSISEDDGKTWSELEPIGDFGGIVATTYGYWTEGAEPYILSVRFDLEELDQRLKQALTYIK